MIFDVIDILRQWPEFAKDFTDEEAFSARLLIPIRKQQLEVITVRGGLRAFYSWTRQDTPHVTLPTEDDWSRDGKWLWIGDLVWDRGLSAREVVEAGQADMIEKGIAKAGETVLFYRSNDGHYGYGTVRER